MADTKPPNPILVEKQAMFAAQASRINKETPLRSQQQAAFARALVTRLEQVTRPIGPARVTMSTAGPIKDTPAPTPREPERIGGCFSDLLDDDTKRNEGAHEKEIESDSETEIPDDDEETPFG